VAECLRSAPLTREGLGSIPRVGKLFHSVYHLSEVGEMSRLPTSIAWSPSSRLLEVQHTEYDMQTALTIMHYSSCCNRYTVNLLSYNVTLRSRLHRLTRQECDGDVKADIIITFTIILESCSRHFRTSTLGEITWRTVLLFLFVVDAHGISLVTKRAAYYKQVNKYVYIYIYIYI